MFFYFQTVGYFLLEFLLVYFLKASTNRMYHICTNVYFECFGSTVLFFEVWCKYYGTVGYEYGSHSMYDTVTEH